MCEMRVGTFGRRWQQGHVCEETSRGRQERAGAGRLVRGGGDRVVGVVEWKGRCEDTGRERQVRLGRSIGVVVKDVYTRGDACAE